MICTLCVFIYEQEEITVRAPKRKRQPRRRLAGPQMGVDLDDIAQRASYIGSPEHKDTQSFAGQPRPRADASICDRLLAQEQPRVTDWLKTAIRRGAISSRLEGDFPRYVWHKEGDIVYEARLVNPGNGEYKGYPLNRIEWPDGLDAIL